MTIRRMSLAAIATLLLGVGGCAQEAAKPLPSGTLSRTLVTSTAKVKEMDQRTRKALIEDYDREKLVPLGLRELSKSEV